MGLYLKIENPGVAPAEAFTLFGCTSKRNSDNPLIIGTFGSGSKHAVNLLLRQGIDVAVFCGQLKLSFSTEEHLFDGQDGRTYKTQRVCVTYGGKDKDGKSRSSFERLQMTLGYGEQDWDNTSLALREFVSNALDACFEQGLNVEQAARAVKVEVVDDSKVRAKAGTTRVFVPLTDDVQRFYSQLCKWFLHFAEPGLVTETILPKANRNVGNVRRPVIYRKGVFVREFESTDKASQFDYNLSDIKINESRTCSDWDVRHACGKAIANANRGHLASLFSAIRSGSDVWEKTLDQYGLNSTWESDSVVSSRKTEWQAAFSSVAGEYGALVSESSPDIAERVSAKGYRAVAVPDAFVEAAKSYGVATSESILTDDDRAGRTYSDPTVDVQRVLDQTWNRIVSFGVDCNKEKPAVRCFYQPMDAGCQTWGLYKNGVVSIHTDIANSESELLRIAVLEELCHHCTGAADGSRDFQTWLVRYAVKLSDFISAGT